jgi:hypothetical protein
VHQVTCLAAGLLETEESKKDGGKIRIFSTPVQAGPPPPAKDYLEQKPWKS